MNKNVYDIEQLKENNAGFSLPDTYFSDNAVRLKLIPNDEMAEQLFEAGFLVPPTYFSNNKKQLIERVNKKNKQIKIFKITVVSGIAAVFLAILGLNYWPTKPISKVELDFNQLTDAEIIEHLSELELNENIVCDAGWCQELKDLNKPNDLEIYLLESDHLDQLKESI